MSSNNLEAVLTLQRDTAERMGSDRIRLLKAIREHGSISEAARMVGLSYKAAWDGVNVMNNLFDQPLVTGQSGGKRGGGAKVTPVGEQVILAFSNLEVELGRFMDRLQNQLRENSAYFSPTFFWSLMMKTSARNMFHCTVSKIVEGAVNSEVILDLTDGQQLTAIITKQSVADMNLAVGKPCFALIKSSFVILSPEDGFTKTSARNRLCGTITGHDDGAVNSEITLDLGGGKTIVSIVTKQSADDLGLKIGDRACALIKASHIILAVE